MRQQLLNKPSDTSARATSRRRRRERAALESTLRRSNHLSQPGSRQRRKNALSSIRGFTLSLMFLAPMASLGTICYALVQNNLRLHEQNDELNGLANEVQAEIDTLSEEIEVIRQRAGVAEEDSDIQQEASAETAPQDRASDSSKTQLPKGGPSKKVDAIDLLKDAKAQVPKLNKALDSAAEPLKATLAAEAAYPTGLPVTGHPDISSEFGLRSNPFSGSGYEMHEGTDFIGSIGDIIAATGEGKVTLAGSNGGYGITVTIDHGYGYETLYAHMSEVRVKVGDRVKRGQIIGHIGSTGRSSGPHLHYSIYKDKKAIDPRKLMKVPENILATGPR